MSTHEQIALGVLAFSYALHLVVFHTDDIARCFRRRPK